MSSTWIHPPTATAVAVELAASSVGTGGLTGLSPVYRLRRKSDGFYLDFADSTFKSSGWTTKEKAMAENAAHAGIYSDSLNPTALNLADGFVGIIEYRVPGANAFIGLEPLIIRTEGSGGGGGGATVAQIWNEILTSGYSIPGSAAMLLKAAAVLGDGSQTVLGSAFTYQTAGATKIDNALVRFFLKADYDAGNRTSAYVKAWNVTDVNGKFQKDSFLDPATYTIVVEKQGLYGPDTKEIAVSSGGFTTSTTITATPVSSISEGAPMDLTTVARVKQFMEDEFAGTSEHDSLIAALIASVSDLFQRKMNRATQTKNRQEFFNVAFGQKAFYTWAFPVASVSSLRYDPVDRAFGTSTEIDATAYDVVDDDGTLIIDKFSLAQGLKVLRLEYVGGMAADTDTFVRDFPEIALAADMTVAFLLRRKRTIHATSSSSGRGGSASLSEPEIPKFAEEVLRAYRRKGAN